MTIDIASLPLEPAEAWTKPTLSNTKGGKLYKPTHPELFRVEFTPSSSDPSAAAAAAAASPGQEGAEESFSSRLVAARDFSPGEVIAPLTNLSRAPEKAYSSVQYGPGPHDHFELNSDLLFMNHACSPSVHVVLPLNRPNGWCITAGPRGIRQGEDVTFFYPSTEWDMAQGFECNCGASDCLGSVRGAKYLSISQLEQRGYVNEHIRQMKSA